MSRKTFLNILENVCQPTVNQAMREDLLGNEPKVTALAAETTLTLDFTENLFHVVTLGSQNLTALNATVASGKNSLKPGEKVYLKIIQDSTAARTVAWGTNILESSLTVTASTDAIDLFEGVFDGTNIILGALAQNVS